jgi:hypothetical protein
MQLQRQEEMVRNFIKWMQLKRQEEMVRILKEEISLSIWERLLSKNYSSGGTI